METIFETVVPCGFKIIRRVLNRHRGYFGVVKNFCYNVKTNTELPEGYVEKVVSLARHETKLAELEDDLDTPAPDGTEDNLFRFSHAIEHLAGIEMVRTSALASLVIHTGNRTGAIIGFYEFRSLKGIERVLGFSFYLDISKNRQDEYQAILNTCQKIIRL